MGIAPPPRWSRWLPRIGLVTGSRAGMVHRYLPGRSKKRPEDQEAAIDRPAFWRFENLSEVLVMSLG